MSDGITEANRYSRELTDADFKNAKLAKRSYACYIFGWNACPNGGVNDLIMCCDTIEEGEKQAKRLASEYKVVHLMDKDGKNKSQKTQHLSRPQPPSRS